MIVARNVGQSEWYLEKYNKISDVYICRWRLNGIGVEDIAKGLGRESSDPMVDMLPVERQHAAFFEHFLNEKFDMDNYEYFVVQVVVN